MAISEPQGRVYGVPADCVPKGSRASAGLNASGVSAKRQGGVIQKGRSASAL